MKTFKSCTKCGQSKPVDEYHSNGGGRLKSSCKVCVRAVNNLKYSENAEDRKERVRQYRLKDIEGYRAKARKWRNDNIEKVRARDRDYWSKNKDKAAASGRAWVDSGKSAEWQNRYYHEVLKHKEEHKVASIARSALGRILKAAKSKKNGRTEYLLGYSFNELRDHLEKNFSEGMSWSNYGQWHVDHIIPLAELVKLGITCPKKINALGNLMPRWAKENMAKGARFELSVQHAQL